MSFTPPDLMTLADAMSFVRAYVDAVTEPDPHDPGGRLDAGIRASLAIATVIGERDSAITQRDAAHAEIAALRKALASRSAAPLRVVR